MIPPTAPQGFLTLGDTALRFKERLRLSGAKAEYRVVREIMEGRVGMATLPGPTRLAPVEGMEFDFIASQVTGAPGGSQVIHMTITDAGGLLLSPEPDGTLVFLDEDEIERLLDELAPRPAIPAGGALYQPPAPPGYAAAGAPKRPAHRPPEYDWSFYETQARRRVLQRGLPEKSSILVREILDLFCRRGDVVPEQRTVERKVAEWWPGLQALAEDMTTPCEIVPEVPLRRS